MVHEIEHEFLKNHAESARADFPQHRKARNRPQGIFAELEPDILEFEEPLVLRDNRVFRPRQNLYKRQLIKVFKHTDDGKTADQFGNQAEFDEVLRLNFMEKLEIPLGTRRICFFVATVVSRFEAKRLLPCAPPDDLL